MSLVRLSRRNENWTSAVPDSVLITLTQIGASDDDIERAIVYRLGKEAFSKEDLRKLMRADAQRIVKTSIPSGTKIHLAQNNIALDNFNSFRDSRPGIRTWIRSSKGSLIEIPHPRADRMANEKIVTSGAIDLGAVGCESRLMVFWSSQGYGPTVAPVMLLTLRRTSLEEAVIVQIEMVTGD